MTESYAARSIGEVFTGYPTPPESFDEELARAGFTPSDVDDPDIVIARRRSRRD